MIRIVETDETFGMFGSSEELPRMIHADDVVQRGMEYRQGNPQFRNPRKQIGAASILDKGASDTEWPAADRHVPFPIPLDCREIAFDVRQHMRYIRRGADGSDSGDILDSGSGAEYGSPAKAVPHQQHRPAEPFDQIARTVLQIGYVGAEPRTAEFPFAAAQTGEVEAQGYDASPCKRTTDRHGGAALFRAGEAVGKQRCPAHQAGRHLQRSCKGMAGRSGDSDGFGRHSFSF